MEGVFRMRNRILSLAILSIAAVAANAQTLTWSGAITANDPVYNRTFSDGTGLSGVGTAVGYDVQLFHVSASGSYVFESNQTWDGMIFVYENAFNAATPLANWKAGDDDTFGGFTLIPGGGGSRIAPPTNGFGSMNLVAGVQYFAITASFNNGGTGSYTNAIGGGPGTVIAGAVPEPMTMTVLALGAVAALRRRNRKS